MPQKQPQHSLISAGLHLSRRAARALSGKARAVPWAWAVEEELTEALAEAPIIYDLDMSDPTVRGDLSGELGQMTPTGPAG